MTRAPTPASSASRRMRGFEAASSLLGDRIRSAGEKRADPPDAGALGWGTSTPRRRVSSSERMMMASLAEVVSRNNHGGTQAQGSRRGSKLPAGMLSALQITAVG